MSFSVLTAADLNLNTRISVTSITAILAIEEHTM